jgi:hypothetical protein
VLLDVLRSVANSNLAKANHEVRDHYPKEDPQVVGTKYEPERRARQDHGQEDGKACPPYHLEFFSRGQTELSQTALWYGRHFCTPLSSGELSMGALNRLGTHEIITAPLSGAIVFVRNFPTKIRIFVRMKSLASAAA